MLKKLKSLFIVEDDSSPESSDTGQASEKIETAPEPDTSEQLADIEEKAPVVVEGGKPDARFVNVLLKAIDAANLEGFDYLEYKQSLQSLAKMDMDEATRYQSAFAMAKTMGASPKGLIDSANHYLQVLAKEDSKFAKALQAQQSKQVGGRESQLKDLESAIIQKRKKIEELTAQIAVHQEELGQSKSSINQARLKIQETAAQFALAYQSVVQQIQMDIDRMREHLK